MSRNLNKLKAVEVNLDGLAKTEAVRLANELIQEVIQSAEASGLAYSVMENVRSLRAGKPYKVADGTWQVDLNFGDNLHRDSLRPDMYEGARDIIELINNGYAARAPVYGYWASAGKNIKSLQTRAGSHFIGQALNSFNAAHSSGDITAVASSDKYN